MLPFIYFEKKSELMRISILCFLFLLSLHSFGQPELTATISNFPQKYVYAYRCTEDSLAFIDSVKTDDKGKFVFKKFSEEGIYHFLLYRNQWFEILYDGNPVEIKTVSDFDMFNNRAADNAEVIKSEENKLFFRFQKIRKELSVANAFLLEMMRLYPLQDAFHPEMEKEWNSRYDEMEKLCLEVLQKNPKSRSAKIIQAYRQKYNPDWKQPDDRRDSIIAAHYFDYFNPADKFFLNTNILPDKIDSYFRLFSSLLRVKRETVSDYERKIKTAADTFLSHTKADTSVHAFCLNYILRKLDRDKMNDALFSVYDKWVFKGNAGDCRQASPMLDKWREKINILRNIQVGSVAPDFELTPEKLYLSQIKADYTLVVFWASWCPHCMVMLPALKDTVAAFSKKIQASGKNFMVVAVSLDTSSVQWQNFVKENKLLSFFNYSDLKGWKSEVVKKFNVFATPSMFLLDKDKKIIGKPETVVGLYNFLENELKK